MKKYTSPEWEILSFSSDSKLMTVSSQCPADCPENCTDDCGHCFFLVCQPEDVIIG